MLVYQNLVIYYFSGTGNAKNIAEWISGFAVNNGINAETIDISAIDRLAVKAPSPDALLIFISPIHGFNYPPVMLHFISHFPSGKNKIILMNTRAGMLIGKYITPGLTGVAFFLSALLLKLKGYTIKGMVPFDMPSNWISIHPGLNNKTVQFIHRINKERAIFTAGKILSGDSYFKALREIIQDVIISPVSLLYYFIGRFGFAKTFYASSDCNNCNLCIKSCPVKAIIKVDHRLFWTFKCESCMHCMSICPKRAIETAHGFLIGLIVLNSFFLTLFFKYWDLYFNKIDNGFIKFVLEQLIFLVLLTILHRIIHYGMRFKLIERLIVYTSLTKYKFWGRRYRALKDNQY